MVVRIIVPLLLFVALALSSRWYPDFREGVQVAKREGKLVLLYFYEEGCNFCKYMEEVVFVDPKVSELMERAFVVVPIDVEDIPPELDRRFRAFGTPTFMVYDPKQDRLIGQAFGLHETDEFLEVLGSACRKGKVKGC